MPAQHVAAAHRSWAITRDRTARTEAMRKAFLAKLDATIPPEIVGEARKKALRNAVLAHYATIRAIKAKRAEERKAAEMRRMVDECLDASDVLDAGSDGINADLGRAHATTHLGRTHRASRGYLPAARLLGAARLARARAARRHDRHRLRAHLDARVHPAGRHHRFTRPGRVHPVCGSPPRRRVGCVTGKPLSRNRAGQAISESNLRARDKYVYRALLERADNRAADDDTFGIPDVMQPVFQGDRNLFGVSRRNVQRALAHLKEHGWVSWEPKSRGSEGRPPNHYTLAIGWNCGCGVKRQDDAELDGVKRHVKRQNEQSKAPAYSAKPQVGPAILRRESRAVKGTPALPPQVEEAPGPGKDFRGAVDLPRIAAANGLDPDGLWADQEKRKLAGFDWLQTGEHHEHDPQELRQLRLRRCTDPLPV